MRLEVDDLHVRYGRVHAVRGVSLKVESGEIVAVLGANGAGKSSLLKALIGLEPAAGGRVTLDGANMTRWPPSRRVREHLVLVPEGRRIVTSLTVHDLAGKRAMLSPHDQELLAYLKREGLGGGRLEQVPQSFDIADLVSGKVDAFSVYTTDQVWQLRRTGLAYTLLSPRAGGIDFYGDTLFTTEQRARGDAARTRAFRDASLRGWQYAMDHPEETADLILARYSRRLPREHLLFEAAEMRRLMQPDLIEIGHMNPGRWRHVAGVSM